MLEIKLYMQCKAMNRLQTTLTLPASVASKARLSELKRAVGIHRLPKDLILCVGTVNRICGNNGAEPAFSNRNYRHQFSNGTKQMCLLNPHN